MWEVWLRVDDSVVCIDLAGHLTSDTVRQVAEILERDIRSAGGRRVHIRLAAVDQADGPGLAMLRRCRTRAQMRGIDLKITDLSHSVRRSVRDSVGRPGPRGNV